MLDYIDKINISQHKAKEMQTGRIVSCAVWLYRIQSSACSRDASFSNDLKSIRCVPILQEGVDILMQQCATVWHQGKNEIISETMEFCGPLEKYRFS